LYARLEQLVKSEQEKFYSLIETQNKRIDYYKTLITALYTGPIKKKFNPIGTFSDFKVNKGGSIMRDIPGVDPLPLQERFDFSGHDNLLPHINYDIKGMSHKKSAKLLGDAHIIDLWDY